MLANRIYQQLSSAVAGSQEFTAIAKLYELDREGGFDAARARHAAVAQRARLPRRARPPDAASSRAARSGCFLRADGLAARVVGRGTGVVFGVLKRVTGVDLLEDLSRVLPLARRR